MPEFSNTVSVLRRWQHFSDSTPLPGNIGQWKQQNGSEFMRLAKADPELLSLLEGGAPAGLVADALTGALAAQPKTVEQRRDEATQAEMQALAEKTRSQGPSRI